MYILSGHDRHVVFGRRQLAKRKEKRSENDRRLVRPSSVAESHDSDDCIQQIQEQPPGPGKHRQRLDKLTKVHSEY